MEIIDLVSFKNQPTPNEYMFLGPNAYIFLGEGGIKLICIFGRRGQQIIEYLGGMCLSTVQIDFDSLTMPLLAIITDPRNPPIHLEGVLRCGGRPQTFAQLFFHVLCIL